MVEQNLIIAQLRARSQLLQQALQERILVIDGAMGTAIQAENLSVADFGGVEYEGCNEVLTLTRPDIITQIHAGYLQAGADIIETNTFGSTALVLAEYNLQDQADQITKTAAVIARKIADEYATPTKPRFVAGAMGPTTKAISVTGGVSFSQLTQEFYRQAKALVASGVDYLLLETCQDTLNIKAGLIGIQQLAAELGAPIPVAVSVTIESSGTMLAGQSIEALITSLEHVDLLYLGVNCATGPEFMTDHVRALATFARAPVAVVPNAGLPDEEGRYLETPAMFAQAIRRFLDEGWVNLVGGCCGTTASHIAALSELAASYPVRKPQPLLRKCVSGIENLEIDASNRPILVGERTNAIGSRHFRNLIAENRFEAAAEIARRQTKNGAQIIDICLANPDRDEQTDMESFLAQVMHKVKVPLMIDSTSIAVMASALTYCQGKSILNSVNLEDGPDKLHEAARLARQYGASIVVGTIDETGMAITKERKLAVAKRAFEILVHDCQVAATDIIFDPLTFPCATGDAQYLGSAQETIAGIKLIKAAMPECLTLLGISNVSFGLPSAGREVLNSVFLYHATQAGLDMAIVNTENLQRYANIPAAERMLAADILFSPDEKTIASFTEHFRTSQPISPTTNTLDPEQTLINLVVQGSKAGLTEALNLKLQDTAPLDIINGPLMAGMAEVGRLFGRNELIVAEVLESAEVMKAAVTHLEQFMAAGDQVSKGTVLLATVKGDVHDIGKNLVDIVLSNNGYKVINLGTKVAPSVLIQAAKEHHPDIIGLSGLLVKSTHQMVVTAQELAQAGINVPLMVGGAALTNSFTRKQIGPAYQGLVVYARDVMQGLDLAHQLMAPEQRQQLKLALQQETDTLLQPERDAKPKTVVHTEIAPLSTLTSVPNPPDYQRHLERRLPLGEIWSYINPVMLYNRHLGLKQNMAKAVATGDQRALKLQQLMASLLAEYGERIEINAVWQFFAAASDANTILLYSENRQTPIAALDFPRQPTGRKLCLTDYIIPVSTNQKDNVCLFVTTAGSGIYDLAMELKDQGDYLRSHAIQALALELAEATAEWLHTRIRGWWGFPDPASLNMLERFKANYRGRRYSFGYPACPELAMQQTLFDLLHPEDIGVQLTEHFMMEPEASVSAMVLHHPQCEYFDVNLGI